MTRLNPKYRNIAVDVDGTILYDGHYPEFGAFKPHAIRVLRKIKDHGGRILIWTCRTGHQADTLKGILFDAGVEYDTFNEELAETRELFGGTSRKVFADVYIDDRANFCEEIDWLWIESKLFIEDEGEDYVT